MLFLGYDLGTILGDTGPALVGLKSKRGELCFSFIPPGLAPNTSPISTLAISTFSISTFSINTSHPPRGEGANLDAS